MWRIEAASKTCSQMQLDDHLQNQLQGIQLKNCEVVLMESYNQTSLKWDSTIAVLSGTLAPAGTIKFALQISNSMVKSALQSLQCNLS